VPRHCRCRENLPKSGPFIICPNHQSYLDGPVVASQIPWRLFKDMFYVGTSEIFGRYSPNSSSVCTPSRMFISAGT